MKFGLVFANAASNHGDVAINRGAVRLLRQLDPGCSVHAVFKYPNDVYMAAARDSIAVGDGIGYSIHPVSSGALTPEDELDAVADALHDPSRFLSESGLGGCDAVLYNSGEHLFASSRDDNALDLLWRTAAALAVKEAGLPLVMLPATFGPCDGPIGRQLLSVFCELNDGLAGREPSSAAALRDIGGARAAQDWLLDPAFFMDGEIGRYRTAPPSDPARRLGLVLRLEDFGLRVGKSQSAKRLAAHKKASFRGSLAHTLALDLARGFMDRGGRRIDVLVQTLADRDLAKAIAADISSQFPSLEAGAVESASLDEYVSRIAVLDQLVSSRFHACIFAMQCDTQVFGVHASEHGHKMPSMFSALGLADYCAPLERPGLPSAIGDRLSAQWDPSRLNADLQRKRQQTLQWVGDALKREPLRPDLPGLNRRVGKALLALGRRYSAQRLSVARAEARSAQEAKETIENLLLEQHSTFAAAQRDWMEEKRLLTETATWREARIDDVKRSLDTAQQALKKHTAAQEAQKKRLAAAAKQASDLQRDLRTVRSEFDAIAGSKRFRLGSAIADALTGWRGFAGFPKNFALAFRSAATPASEPAPEQALVIVTEPHPPAGRGYRLPTGRTTFTAAQKQALEEALDLAFGEQANIEAFLEKACAGAEPVMRAYALARASTKARERGLLDEAYRYASLARENCENLMSLTALAAAAHHLCDYPQAVAIARTIRTQHVSLQPSVARLLDEIEGYASLAEEAKVPPAHAQAITPNRSVYLLHSSLPHLSGGYALRAHGLIKGIQSAGWDVRSYTRPGFPADTAGGDAADYPAQETIEGVVYRRTASETARADGEHRYMQACVDAFSRVLEEERPEVVHGRSTYLISLPAMIAARRHGLPFVYEVSGLWELVHESREDAGARKARTQRMRHFETLVMQGADRVVTLTEAMREELIARGVAPGKITLAPNSVDPQKYLPVARDQALAASLGLPPGVPVIGYVGSFVDYEGLDDLLSAARILHDEGVQFRLLMVGDGADFVRIKSMAESGPLSSLVILTGRVPYDQVRAFYSLIDICPFPRKPWQVCEVVSPMKPFEAMSMEKAVVVSDTRALCDIVIDGETGSQFAKGSVPALADALRTLVQDTSLRERLGKRAREWVIENRSWNAMGDKIVQQYRAAIEDTVAASPQHGAIASGDS